MGDGKEGKRKKDEYDNRKEKQTKRARTRSRSPEAREKGSSRSRRRHHSRSRSAERPSKRDRQNQVKETPQESEVKKEMPERKNREDMLNTRTGGAYIPPARLRMLQAQITDKSSIAYQRLAWEALKKSIHGHINKINVGNIGIIIKELLKENIVRGRGLLCRSVIQAQAASPTFTNVYAALVSAVNSRFPNIGELLLKRLVIQFKRGFKRNDKPTCISSASFVAHLVNQRVAHEILALELLTLLVETPTDDSVEVAIAFLKECGQKLTEVSSKGVNAIFEMLRNILHEGQLDKRVQYMIEVMFQVWKDGFKDHPALIDDLELVPEEEQFTHLLMLDDATDPQDILNVFKFDDKYEENEQKYKTLSKEILGSDAEDSNEEGSGESGSDESEEEEEETEEKTTQGVIIDNTETNLVALRRTIYLTINSSLDFEECAHKLMKMQLKPGQEVELCHMFLDCCAEQRTYEKFYGLLAQRFCNINRIYIDPFQQIFKDSYSTAHRLDTNRLRNVSKFFAHLLFTDSIGWDVLDCVKLNEEDTTSSSRIYIKILFQELAEYMGLKKLNDRLKDPTLQDAFQGVFPRDNPKNTRFSINFFTSIGLGGLTDELREHLKQMPKNVPAQITEIKLDSSSSESSSDSSSSSSEDSSSDSSSSDGEDEGDKKKENNKDKKSKKKDAEAPKPPEEVNPPKAVERWGHEGFFETYGKDARRTEPRPDRRERDNDNFLKPRDDRDTRKKDFNQRNDNVGKDDRRDGPYRREEDSRRNRDDDRRRDREDYSRYRREDDSNSRREEEGRGNRDDNRKRDNGNRSRDFDDYRNKNHDDERRGDRDTRSRREDDSSSRKEEESRRNKDDSGIRDKDNRSRDFDDYRNKNHDDERRRDRDTRSRREDDSSSRKEEESRRNKDDSGIRDKDNRSRDFDDYRNKNHDDERRRDRDTRSRREDDSSSRKEEESRRNKDDSRIRDKDNRSRDFDDYRSKHHEDQRKRERGDNSKSRREEEHGENRDDNRRRDKDNRILDDNNKKNKKEEKKRKNESSDEESRTPEKEKHLRSKNKKSKHKQESDESSSESSSSESSSDSSSTRKKTKRSNKENSKYGKSTTPDDGWDIRRAESVRKEVVGRYWDN